MITKMKKYTFLITNKEYDSFIYSIRKIGVVHIDQLQQGSTSQEFEKAKTLNDRFENALKSLDYAKETYTSDKGYKQKTTAENSALKSASTNLRTSSEAFPSKTPFLNSSIL